MYFLLQNLQKKSIVDFSQRSFQRILMLLRENFDDVFVFILHKKDNFMYIRQLENVEEFYSTEVNC